MVDAKTIQKQLKKLKFGGNLWNQAELRELPHILHEGETISECVNGFYEGGVALLVATEMRVLLIDKKPLNYLTVEDLRFDMINEIDYSHRLMGATITISTGSKTLKFKSFNQARLRRLINLVQQHMSDGKKSQAEKAESQQQHLEEINKQLQMYLLAQHQYLQKSAAGENAQPVKPGPELSDYLFAQRLLEKFHDENAGQPLPIDTPAAKPIEAQAHVSEQAPEPQSQPVAPHVTQSDMVAEAKREVFGGIKPQAETSPRGLEINPLKVAYSKLPMMLRNRRFGRPSLHAHSQQETPPAARQVAPSST